MMMQAGDNPVLPTTLNEARSAFETIYQRDLWTHGSGPGSLPVVNKRYIRFLQDFIRENRISRVIDVGCGDWQLGAAVDWGNVDYLGVDIVPSVITANRDRHGRPGRRFEVFAGDWNALPDADLVLAKDVIQHWPTSAIQAWFPHLQRYRFALITNDLRRGEYVANGDIPFGAWRPLDLAAAPFHRQEPIVLLYGRDSMRLADGSSILLGFKATYLFSGGRPAVPLASVALVEDAKDDAASTDQATPAKAPTSRARTRAYQRTEPSMVMIKRNAETDTERLQREIGTSLAMLTPVAVVGIPKIRIGGGHDGGYVMIDDLAGTPVCYSLGVGPDVSWDFEMANRGCLIHQYDHTVAEAPIKHENFRFNRLGIAPNDQQPNMQSLPTLITQNGNQHDRNMLLKMDIEDAEWDVFDALPSQTFDQFKQIVCELHYFSRLIDLGWRQRFDRVMTKLRATHLPVHIHGNNYGPLTIVHGLPVPEVLEMTFARRDLFAFKENTEIFPSALDQPCNPHNPELYLGRFEF